MVTPMRDKSNIYNITPEVSIVADGAQRTKYRQDMVQYIDMRLGFLLLLVAVFYGSNFWYTQLSRTCVLPVTYTIGEVDARFHTSKEELARIARRAEAVWEDALGRDIFVHDNNQGVPIHLVFDERQKSSNAEEELREDIEAKAGMSESFAKQYDVLIAHFRELKGAYEQRAHQYSVDLNAYNTEVQSWNDRGGAPETEVNHLNQEKERLRLEYETLKSDSNTLNGIVSELNRIGARGNYLIQEYNDTVNTYNTQFGEEHEFTQGDYAQKEIRIYQFDSEDELVIVIAHELGHALGIEHVVNEQSIMYSRMQEQSVWVGLSEEDKDAFTEQCIQKSSLWGYVRSHMGL